MNGLLGDKLFKKVIESTPLISFDFVVINKDREILLGERKNRPAQGTWFVPGGRIRKNERLDEAFIRLTAQELGQVFSREKADFLGVYEHFYDDNMFDAGYGCAGTHYVVLAYAFRWPMQNIDYIWPKNQHNLFRWWLAKDALACAAVHANSKTYLSLFI